jgi:hypothetical protein
MMLNNEGERKLILMKTLARKQYNRLSVLSDSLMMEDYNPVLPSHGGGYLQLPYRPQLPIGDFNDPATVLDFVFMEIGRGLAFSETKFLAEHLERSVESRKVQKTPLQGVLDFVANLRNSGREPSVIFAPIDYYMDWYDDLMIAAGHNVPFRITNEEEKSYFVLPDGSQIRWIWSNKLSPFNDFFILDKSWARWISKRSEEDGERFQIDVKVRGDKLDVIFRLVFKLDIIDTDAIRRFTPLKGRSVPLGQPQS